MTRKMRRKNAWYLFFLIAFGVWSQFTRSNISHTGSRLDLPRMPRCDFHRYQISCQIRVRWQQSKFETYMRCLMVMSLSVPIATHCMCCSDVINLKGGSLEHNNNSSHFCSIMSHWQGWAHGSLLRQLLLEFKFDLKLTVIQILLPTEFAATGREAQLHPRKVCKHQQVCGGTADRHSKHHLCGSRPCCFL